MSAEDEFVSYLVGEKEYREVVGKLLVHRIAQVFKELGFETRIFRVNANGVDIQVYKDSELVIVGEVLNWCCRSNLPEERKDRIVNNLLKFECHRVLICTPFENTAVLSDLPEKSPVVLDEGEYFVVGDNRAMTETELYQTQSFGKVRHERLVGKVLF